MRGKRAEAGGRQSSDGGAGGAAETGMNWQTLAVQ